MSSLTIHGARVVCYINGSVLGVNSFKFTSDTPRRPVYCLDMQFPGELVLQSTRIVGTLGVYRQASDGGIEGVGMIATTPDLMSEKYFTILLVDRVTDTVLFSAELCSVLSQDWQVSTKDLMHGTIQFQAILWSNEVRPFNTPSML
jgi:hypothetical protein